MLQNTEDESGILGGEDTAESRAGSKELWDSHREWLAGDCALGVSIEAQEIGTDDVAGGNPASQLLPSHL